MIFLGYDCLGKPAIYLYVYMTRNISYIKIIIMYIYTNKNTCIQFINIIMRYSKASMYRLCIIQTTSNKGFPVFIACFQVISRTQVGILLLYRISNRFCIGSSRHPIRVSSASVRSKKKDVKVWWISTISIFSPNKGYNTSPKRRWHIPMFQNRQLWIRNPRFRKTGKGKVELGIRFKGGLKQPYPYHPYHPCNLP